VKLWEALFTVVLSILALCPIAATDAPDPKPLGQLVDLGGYRLHVHCTGRGKPIVVVENGLGDFSFDWSLVQSQVSKFARTCTYDRAGYAWSEPGPKPRTFAQLNFELREVLSKLGEQGPYVMVGHSYGGPVVRSFALNYANVVAGMVLVDAAFEGERVGIGGKAMIRLGDGAHGKSIPPIRNRISDADKPVIPPEAAASVASRARELDPMYKVLPPAEQQLQLWAQTRLNFVDAEDSQREWSAEYFAKWLSSSQTGTLGSIPLLVLTRANGGYGEGEYDLPAAQLEAERKSGQASLVTLSSNSKQILLPSGHNMELEAPDAVVAAIREVVEAVRNHRRLN
jgi:pimeloyl-ACP methyl ester carboxylesterase